MTEGVEQAVMNMARMIAKNKLRRQTMVDAIEWAAKELENPQQPLPPGFTQEEKNEKLKQAKENGQKAIEQFDQMLEEYKTQMKEQGFGSILAVAEVMSEVVV